MKNEETNNEDSQRLELPDMLAPEPVANEDMVSGTQEGIEAVKQKEPVYKKKQFWIVVGIVFVLAVGVLLVALQTPRVDMESLASELENQLPIRELNVPIDTNASVTIYGQYSYGQRTPEPRTFAIWDEERVEELYNYVPKLISRSSEDVIVLKIDVFSVISQIEGSLASAPPETYVTYDWYQMAQVEADTAFANTADALVDIQADIMIEIHRRLDLPDSILTEIAETIEYNDTTLHTTQHKNYVVSWLLSDNNYGFTLKYERVPTFGSSSKTDFKSIQNDFEIDDRAYMIEVPDDGNSLIVANNFSYLNTMGDGSAIDQEAISLARDGLSVDALNLVKEINSKLDLSDALFEQISHTRAIDGMQHYEQDGIRVSWTYSPSEGLYVLYERY